METTNDLAKVCSHTTIEAASLMHGTEVTVGGAPRPLAFDLEDEDGTIRCVLSDTVVVRGYIDRRTGSLMVRGLDAADECVPRYRVTKAGFPDGDPRVWSVERWNKAFEHFAAFYHAGGIYEDFFAGQPTVTMAEFQTAIKADFEAAVRGEIEHPLFEGHRWEWASVERERVRDRILVTRGHEPIGYFGDGHEDGWLGRPVEVLAKLSDQPSP